jgi:hypothetical protein
MYWLPAGRSRLFVSLVVSATFIAITAQVIPAADDPKSDAAAKADKAKAAQKKAADDKKKEQNAKARRQQQRRQQSQKSAVPEKFPIDTGAGGLSLDEARAIGRIGGEIRDAVALQPTLVVWLIELSPEAEPLRNSAKDAIVDILQQLGDEHPGKLEMAVVGYGADARIATETPVAKTTDLQSALAGLSNDRGGRVNLFGAVRKAVEKFGARRSSGAQVLFGVVGTSSGDDLNEADAVLLALKRAVIPVFGIGPPARFGLTAAQISRGRMDRSMPVEDSPAESFLPERIRLALPGQQGTVDLSDSGYGPFGLERLCRQSGGRYVRLRDVTMSGWSLDLAIGDIRPDLAQRYLPDYVDDAQYRRLLSENKCRLALHEASKLPALTGIDAMSAEFMPTENEARLAQQITARQQNAAIKDQPIQQLYDTLAKGESDRPKLTGARWQAGYDLAMGQAMSAKARLDGFNAMLATLKQGKKFSNPGSKTWVLEPADEIAAGSALDKMAKNSRVYLKRVVEEHKGTPWAAIAERELKYPAGWKFVEK